jgi:Holliday junction resolvase RusA-like endonuclease
VKQLIIIPGNPVPKGRPRLSRWGAFTPEKTRSEERRIASLLRLEFRRPPFKGEIRIKFSFFMKDHRRVDIDNLIKLCMDSMNLVIYCDDSQVHVLEATKNVSKTDPRTEICFEEIEYGKGVDEAIKRLKAVEKIFRNRAKIIRRRDYK